MNAPISPNLLADIIKAIGYHPTWAQLLSYLESHPKAVSSPWIQQAMIDYCKKEIAAGHGGDLIA